MANPKSGVFTLNERQRGQLQEYCKARGWEFATAPYAFWKVKAPNMSLVAYESGKLTVQGKMAAEFIEFTLEPEILQSFAFSAAKEAVEPRIKADDFPAHGGIDESGKGDFFGPLVVAGAYVDGSTAQKLVDLGVKDSKLIKSTKQIYAIAPQIRAILPRQYAVITVGPEAYNRMYGQIRNLNRLLAWGHARVIENLLELVPDCPRMLSDKFGAEYLIKRALMQKGRQVILDQQVRAEADVAVAAASILAREGFLRGMERLSREFGIELPRGASAQVSRRAQEVAEKFGLEALTRCAKVHFKTFEILKNKIQG